ncbi:hypothetical protein ACP70R_044364 [Stipagrostis hirtigluma subsp. patula]
MENSSKLRVRLEYRYSARGCYNLMHKLSHEQREAVKSIEFDSLLDIPYHTRIDRKFYCWLLSRFDTRNSVLIISDDHQVSVTTDDVHRVLGIPNGKLSVYGNSNKERSDSIGMVRDIFELDDDDSMPALTDVEVLLEKTRSCSTEEEKQKFLTCFTILVASKLLSPRQKYERVPSELCPAFANVFKSASYAWCGYVVKDLVRSAAKVKKALKNGADAINLHGCFMALMLIYIDSLPISRMLVPQSDKAKLAVYNPRYFSEVVKMDTVKNKLDGYKTFMQHMSVEVPDTPEREQKRNRRRGRSHSMVSRTLLRGKKRNTTDPDNHELAGALDVNDIHIQPCSDIVMLNVHEYGIEGSNINNSSQGQTPLLLDTVHTDGDTSIPSCHTTMTDAYSTTTVNVNNNYDYSNNNITIEDMEFLTDHQDEPVCHDAIDYAQQRDDVTSNSLIDAAVVHAGIQTGNTSQRKMPDWSSDYKLLWLPKSASIDVPRFESPGDPFDETDMVYTDKLCQWIELTPTHAEYLRDWIDHWDIRTVAMTGETIRQQLFESLKINRDLCELSVRALREREMGRIVGEYSCKRHFLSPDWPHYILNGIPATEESFFKPMFVNDSFKYNVAKCRMVICPVEIEQIWACYVWDFFSKRLTIIDPTISPMSQDYVGSKHFKEAPKLHGDLMRCMDLYCGYNGTETDLWVIRMLTHVTDRPSSTRSGLHSLYCATQFDGVSLRSSLCEDYLLEFRNKLLFNILKLQGNRAPLPKIRQRV